MQKGRLSAPLSSPIFTEMHQNPSWVFGCWQETFDAVKLASAPLYWAPPTHSLLCWWGEVEHAFPAAQPIQPMGVFLGAPEAASEERAVVGGDHLQGNLCLFPAAAQLQLPGLQQAASRCTADRDSQAEFFGEGNPSSGPRHRAHIQAGAISPLGWLLVGWDPKRCGSLSTWCWQLWEPGAGLVPAQQRISTLPKGYPLSWGGEGWVASASCPLAPRCCSHCLTLASPLGTLEQLSVPATRCHDGKNYAPVWEVKICTGNTHVKKKRSP